MEGIRITLARIGKSQTHEILVYEDATLVHTAQAKVVDDTARAKCIEGIVAKLPALSASDVERAILDEIAAAREVEEAPVALTGQECIVPPERFILPDVNGVAIPRSSLNRGVLTTNFAYYVQHLGGRRDACVAATPLEIAEDRHLIVDPLPSVSGSAIAQSWSEAARKDWLAGSDAPTVPELFEAVMGLVSEHVAFPDYDRPADAYAQRSRAEWREHDQLVWSALTSVWIVLSYNYAAFTAFPYLWISGHAGSGKTRLLEVISQLAFRPLVASSCSAASVFRSLHDLGGTLIVDEAERLKSRDSSMQEIVSILNAGYRPGSPVLRCEECGGQIVTRAYRCYGPKCIASIGEISETLASRSIPIKMLRSRQGYAKRLLRSDPAWQTARDKLYAFSLAHGPKWLEISADEDLLDLGGRDFEVWGPLVAAAKWLGPEAGIPNLVEMLAEHIELSRSVSSGVVVDEQDEHVLRTLAGLLGDREQVRCKELLAAARQADPILMRDFKERGISAALARVGLRTEKRHRRPVYTQSALPRLARVQEEYGVDLGLNEEGLPHRKEGSGSPNAAPQNDATGS